MIIRVFTKHWCKNGCGKKIYSDGERIGGEGKDRRKLVYKCKVCGWRTTRKELMKK